MIVVNKMICPDGHVLHSRFTHEYLEHTDKDGNFFMLDGGVSRYIRYSNESKLGVLLTIEDTDNISLIREHLLWGRNYNTKKELLPKTEWVLLKEIDDSHLDALIQYCEDRLKKYKNADKWKNIFEREKEFRKT